jgi:hypothetical protein
VKGFGRGAEFEQTQTLQVQQKVAAARIEALLSPQRKDWKKAQEVLEASRYALGPMAPEYEKAIETAKQNVGADDLALQLVNGARGRTASSTSARPSSRCRPSPRSSARRS